MVDQEQMQTAVARIQSVRIKMASLKESGTDISTAESHFSRLRYYFEKKDFVRVDEIVERIAEILKRVEEENSKFVIYQRILSQALDDGIISSDENRILRAIRRRMNITDEKHQELMQSLVKPSAFTLSAYEAALEQAMMNGVVTDEEQDLLDRFRESANISLKDHMELEDRISRRSKMFLKGPVKKKSLFDRSKEDLQNIEILEEQTSAAGEETILEAPVEESLEMGDPNYWIEQGKILWYASDDLERDYNDIVDRFQNAIEIDPETPMGWATLGSFLKKMGRLESALDCLDMAIWLDPNMMNPLYNKAMVLSSLGRIPEAIDMLNQVLKKDPGNENAKRKLALLSRAVTG